MRRLIRFKLLLLFTVPLLVSAAENEIVSENIDLTATVYKSPTCGCCSKWITHLQKNNFNVNVREVQDVTLIKQKHKVPRKLYSCHTAVIGDYIIEGHIPANIIKEFILKNPKLAGIAVPGMPPGSPGMESPNPKVYRVYTFDSDGNIEVYQTVFPMCISN